MDHPNIGLAQILSDTPYTTASQNLSNVEIMVKHGFSDGNMKLLGHKNVTVQNLPNEMETWQKIMIRGEAISSLCKLHKTKEL